MIDFVGTTVELSGISKETTAFAPILQFDPIFTFSITLDPGKNVTLFPTLTFPAGMVT